MPRIRPHTCETGWGIFLKTHLNIANTHLPTKDIYRSKHLPVLTASNYAQSTHLSMLTASAYRAHSIYLSVLKASAYRAHSVYLSVLTASAYLCSQHLSIAQDIKRNAQDIKRNA